MINSRILVVDDEKGVVRSCVRILQRQGFTVSGRTDSAVVPELLCQESFDLLLTDIRMPKIDGLKLLQIAKEIDPHLSVVLITGYGTMEDAIKAIHLGAQGFLIKPFEPEELVQAVQDNLSRRALIRDSLRLQTLLPLLEINQMLRPDSNAPAGDSTAARRVLEIAHRETGAGRIALWHNRTSVFPALSSNVGLDWAGPETAQAVEALGELAAVSSPRQAASRLPEEAMALALNRACSVGVLADGSLIDCVDVQPNVVGIILPLIVKEKVVGLLTAETGEAGRAGPFNQLSLDLLSVLAGQLAIVLENVQLFQQTETLHALNEDIIQNMTNGLIAIDKDQRVTAFNPAAAIMLGCERTDALYQPLPEVLPRAEALILAFNNTLTSGQGCSRQEIVVHHWDGTSVPVAVSTAPLTTRDAAGELVGVVGVLEDLSEQKALEAERRRLDRLAALGEMSAVVAHEIRNPIAGIAAGVDYFTRNIPVDSPEYEGAEMIQGEIKRVNRILEDILFVARPLRLNLSNEDIPAVIDSVLQRCRVQLTDSRVEVVTSYAENLPCLRIDRQQLEQVFTNFIVNATQAMAGGGQLLLQVGLVAAGTSIDQRSLVITVTDTGPGIPAEIQRRIFEPFFTTKTKGTGLGLAVARRIIEEHGGTIQVESKEQEGTRFIINLPITGRTAS